MIVRWAFAGHIPGHLLRDEGFIEVISGLNEGDLIVAEGLKKVNPKGKIKPIKK